MRADPRACVPLLVVLTACGVARAAAPLVNTNLPLKFEAQSSEFDYRNNAAVFRKVEITQGDMKVAADEATATGLDTENSHWDFRGRVRITIQDGLLQSDAASVQFRASTLDTALVTGTPATFEQTRDKGVARGHARRIAYEFTTETVTLSEDAWLSYADSQMAGRTLVYRIRDQRVLANPADQGDQRVTFTINPKAIRPSPKAGP